MTAQRHVRLAGSEKPPMTAGQRIGPVAVQVELDYYETEGRRYRCRTGPLSIGQELDGIVTGVFGLDDRPQAKPHLRHQSRANASFAGFTGQDVAKLYGFPDGDGSGECIALIELGGGFRPSDIKNYFQPLGRSPKVVSVSVDHSPNHPTRDPNNAHGQGDLDIEFARAVSP